jgi:chemotaxis protein MotC
MSTLRVLCSLLALASACAPALGQERAATPSELVRSLRAAQDKVALGDVDAHVALRALLVDVGGQLLAIKPEVWKEPGNARAAVAFVLSGGDGRLLRRVVALGPLPGVSDKLLQGVLARGEGRPGEAAELLLPIDARSLDPSIAGHVALVQAELVAKKDPKKAVAFLDDARLLAPGTLIEEAALRRQVGIVAAIGEFDRFEMLAANYMRRFPRSIYAAAFRRQFAADMAGRDDAAEPSRLERMSAVLEAMGPAERRDAYLSIAREALARGKVELARFAAGGAARLAGGEEADRRRAKLYEGAALVATADFEAAMATLQALDEAQLAEEDLALLEAARAVGAEVARPTPSAEATGPKPAEDMAAAFKVADTARGAIARADELIAIASK